MLLCFWHLSESRFFFFFFFFFFALRFAQKKEIANICHYLMQNHLSYLLMYKNFYSSHWFSNNRIFLLFPMVKTNANYVEICRVGILEADFQLVPLVIFFFWSFTILMLNVNNSNSAKKSKKKYFLRQKLKKKSLYYKIAEVKPIFSRKFNFRVNIWENTQKQKKTNDFW